jgi:hypothetical protein
MAIKSKKSIMLILFCLYTCYSLLVLLVWLRNWNPDHSLRWLNYYKHFALYMLVPAFPLSLLQVLLGRLLPVSMVSFLDGHPYIQIVMDWLMFYLLGLLQWFCIVPIVVSKVKSSWFTSR